MNAATTVRCVCGKTEMVVMPGTTVTNLRCAFCPPAHPKPKLTMVPRG